MTRMRRMFADFCWKVIRTNPPHPRHPRSAVSGFTAGPFLHWLQFSSTHLYEPEKRHAF
jgi:hypothetical protein